MCGGGCRCRGLACPPNMAAVRLRRLALAALLAYDTAPIVRGVMCPGIFDVSGHGPVALTNAGANTPGTNVGSLDLLPGGQIVAHMDARTYFADACMEGIYSNTKYSAMKLLGKKLTYTTEVGDAGCGCNAAFYLVSMRQNPQISTCSDYYCDANEVCGVSCAEIDIQENNKHAWHSTLHSATDHSGVGAGYGGGDSWNGPRDFTSAQYGPGSACVDTLKPIEVEVAFPVDGTGHLQAMEVTLTQKGRRCPLRMKIGDYANMAQLSDALAAGMTPVISYWKSGDMLWMDGKGADGLGPCAADTQTCGAAVKFSNFHVEPLSRAGPAPAPPAPAPAPAPKPAPKPAPLPLTPPPPAQPQPPVVHVPQVPAPMPPAIAPGARAACTPAGQDCHTSKCCANPGFSCFEKNKWWASCKPFCVKGIDPLDPPQNQQPWSCKALGAPAGGTPPLPRFKEIVVKVPADAVPGNLGSGADVTFTLGQQQLHGEVVRVREMSPGESSGGDGGNAGLSITLVVAGLALLGIGVYAHFQQQTDQQPWWRPALGGPAHPEPKLSNGWGWLIGRNDSAPATRTRSTRSSSRSRQDPEPSRISLMW